MNAKAARPERVLSRTGPSVRVVTVGAASSANKGAASMLQGVIDTLSEFVGPCHIDVLTTYPHADAAQAPRANSAVEIRIVPFRPWEMVFLLFPVALLYRLARSVGWEIPPSLLPPALRSLAEADVVLDLAGISFADGRGLPTLAYNVLMTGIPLLVAERVMKCSQALGPFREFTNRVAARVVLPRLTAVVARGPVTAGHLDDLGLKNQGLAADLAYTMRVPPEARTEAQRLVHESALRPGFVAVIPSVVMEGYCGRAGIDYLSVMIDFVRRLTEDGEHVLLLAHSARPGRRGGRMNDLPLVREIHRQADVPGCKLLDGSLSPETLRAVIGAAETVVTARFHGLVSALCETTPAMVTGWSHKYREVLTPFELEAWVLEPGQMEGSTLHHLHRNLQEQAPWIRDRIRDRLPVVTSDARRNFQIIAQGLEGPGPHDPI